MILVCGEALIDFLPTDNHSDNPLDFSGHPGGSPFNTAVGIARQNVASGFFGAVSTDFFGQILRDFLTREHVDTSFLRPNNHPTMLTFVHTDSNDTPHYTFIGEQTADRMLMIDDLPESLPKHVDCLAFGSFSLAVSPCAQAYEALIRREYRQRVIALDPNIRLNLIPDLPRYRTQLESLLTYVTIAKASREDLTILYGTDTSIETIAHHWRQQGPKLVVITDGENGAYTLFNGCWKHYPGKPVSVVDTVGAGDTFQASLLAGLSIAGRLSPDGMKRLTDVQLSSYFMCQSVSVCFSLSARY